MTDSAYFIDPKTIQPGEAILRSEYPGYGPGWFGFTDPSTILCALHPEEVEPIIERASRFAQEGGYAMGFVSYEAAPGLNANIHTHASHSSPLAWFGLYNQVRFFKELLPVEDLREISLLDPELSYEDYLHRFESVKAALAEGRTYQVNLTFKQPFSMGDSPARFFANRCGIRPPEFAAFIHGGDWQLASFSPELFFSRVGQEIRMRPMKGTQVADHHYLVSLSNDIKSMAENVMIVDMIRNDLGSVCETGTVSVERLLHVEKHRNLYQMTSTVTGQTDCSVASLFKALFPCASVTGAPKVSTCDVISRLESSPREVYCGAIGVIGPGFERFSVGIRTALIDSVTGVGSFGIGSGLVWDSEPSLEYQECLDKRDFLLNSGEPWRLVEVIPGHRIEDWDYVHEHLMRLMAHAQAFEIPLALTDLAEELVNLGKSHPEQRVKVRISVSLDGCFEISCRPSAIQGDRIQATLATRPIGSQDPNMRIKTNSRSVFEGHLDEHPEFDEVLLFNENGEVTEFCNGNVVIARGDEWITPDPSCGCLRGIAVKELVESGKVRYDRIDISDLAQYDRVWFVNSVVGMIEVEGLCNLPRPE